MEMLRKCALSMAAVAAVSTPLSFAPQEVHTRASVGSSYSCCSCVTLYAYLRNKLLSRVCASYMRHHIYFGTINKALLVCCLQFMPRADALLTAGDPVKNARALLRYALPIDNKPVRTIQVGTSLSPLRYCTSTACMLTTCTGCVCDLLLKVPLQRYLHIPWPVCVHDQY